ncbi:hypothetical protein JAAARDRAFT_45063 [Jaapia argillacea MUCL 33604]|uniref:Peptidase A1 domain-containing protein n=1 Tax=Jaapia argillacea MUCL 33604 TaxID=933084 RepID=A0A067Q5G0_9AGAM|nr:hypothetical protein JAAARDRAFT_45063 [Jaapia argillacea MUCL 33604]
MFGIRGQPARSVASAITPIHQLCGAIYITPNLPLANRARPPGDHLLNLASGNRQGNMSIDNLQNTIYGTSITLGGVDMIVVIDSGSSDLWVYPPSKLQLINRTSIHGNLSCGEGTVQVSIKGTVQVSIKGTVQVSINFAKLKNRSCTVPSQAFINVQNHTEADGLFEQGIYGVLGLAFDNSSTAYVLLKQAYGSNDTRSDAPHQHFPTKRLYCQLHNDLASTPEGEFTISEYIPRFSNIFNAPKLSRGVWIVPCLNTTDLEFTLGGDAFFIHPVDITNLTTIELPNGSSVTFCFNTCQPFTLDPKGFLGFDMILGDAFLRNVCALFDYGDYNNSDGFSNRSTSTSLNRELISLYIKLRVFERI